MTFADLPFRVVHEHKPCVALGLLLLISAPVLYLGLFFFAVSPAILYMEFVVAPGEGSVTGAALFLLGVAIWVASVVRMWPRFLDMMENGLRLMVPDQAAALRRTRGAPVLFLRSFSDDGLLATGMGSQFL
jgi:hypothetical protein